MAFGAGYGGGNSRPTRTFHTGLMGSDSTGANVISKLNYVVKNQKGRRDTKPKTNRWG